MSDNDTAARSPYDELLTAARQAMIATYPDFARAIGSGKLWKIEEGFAADALAEKGKCMQMHRFSEERQRQEIGDDSAAIFVGLSQSMIDFYRRKLEAAK